MLFWVLLSIRLDEMHQGVHDRVVVLRRDLPACMQVTLWNTGEDAYQHNLFGDWLTIERVIKTAGSTQYKLLNSSGKKVSE